MKHPENEITLYFDPDSWLGKKTLAYAHTICPNVREINYLKNPLTQFQLEQVIQDLGLQPSDVIDRNHELYQKYVEQDFAEADWLKILSHTPALLLTPIAIMGKQAIIVHNPVDVLSLKPQNMATAD
jgi:arsenate reductase-like glutaredoxin family protein